MWFICFLGTWRRLEVPTVWHFHLGANAGCMLHAQCSPWTQSPNPWHSLGGLCFLPIPQRKKVNWRESSGHGHMTHHVSLELRSRPCSPEHLVPESCCSQSSPEIPVWWVQDAELQAAADLDGSSLGGASALLLHCPALVWPSTPQPCRMALVAW